MEAIFDFASIFTFIAPLDPAISKQPRFIIQPKTNPLWCLVHLYLSFLIRNAYAFFVHIIGIWNEMVDSGPN